MKEIPLATQIKASDIYAVQQLGISSLQLMELAAGAVVATLKADGKLTPNQKFQIWCGGGNNGGDGLAIARKLFLLGAKVEVFCPFADQLVGDAAWQWKQVQQMPIEKLSHPPIPDLKAIGIDALTGTGFTGLLKEPLHTWIKDWSTSGQEVVAIDLPSGLSSDSGAVEGPVVQAQMSISFGYPRIAHYVYPAAKYCGKVIIADIGLPVTPSTSNPTYRFCGDSKWFYENLILRPVDGHKGTSGSVLVIGGNNHITGAPLLTSKAAYRAGAGLVRVLMPAIHISALYGFLPEAIGIPTTEENAFSIEDVNHIQEYVSNTASWVIGPGIGRSPATQMAVIAFLEMLKKSAHKCVMDADALYAIKNKLPILTPDCILTPHPGEFAALLDIPVQQLQENRLEYAEEFVRKHPCVLVLKGAGTLVVSPNGNTGICTLGDPVLSSAGSGDILAGLIGGWLAQGYASDIAAMLGVIQHARAGEILAQKGILPMGLVRMEISQIFPAITQALLEMGSQNISNQNDFYEKEKN